MKIGLNFIDIVMGVGLSISKLFDNNASGIIYFEEPKPKNFKALVKSLNDKYEDKIDRSN